MSSVLQFVEFVDREQLGSFQPNQWEVTYVNQIPQGSVWTILDESSFFRPLGCVPTISGVVTGESFNGEWHFTIPEKKGRLHVQWQHGVKSLGEGKEEEQHIVRLTFTARGPVVADANSQHEAITNGLDLGRRTIVLAFTALMSAEANEYWGFNASND